MSNFITKIKQIFKNTFKKRLFFGVFIVLSAIVLSLGVFNIYFLKKIYPNTYVAGVNVGGMEVSEATSVIENNVRIPETINISGQGQNFEIKSSSIGAIYDATKTAERAYYQDRTGNIFFDAKNQISSLFKKRVIGLFVQFNEKNLTSIIQDIAGNVFIAPVYPSVSSINGNITVQTGSTGVDVDEKLIRALIGESYSLQKHEVIQIPTKIIDPTLTPTEAQSLKTRAEKFIGKNITLNFEFQTFSVTEKDMLNFLVVDGYDDEKISEKIGDVSKNVDREPQDSKFVFEENRVKEFAPSKDGIKTDSQKLKDEITDALKQLEGNSTKTISINIPVETTSPKITTSEVNNLGIKELIGRGSSRFTGSIPSRVHNVGHASSKVNGVLVAPGETLSFNNVVGDVSALTGYQQAYVIKDGKTVLGDGGGLCQVSTTLFRAALDAGLPILERRAHSYRVGYYEQDLGPGIDATVYSPTTDLKIKNDTPGHLLIQTHFDAKAYSLVFEIYGTSDGRVAKTTKPIVTNVTTPPEDLYQDDPSLPVGVVKQVEHRANGAKVTFNYTVERDGQKIYEKDFVSNYRPWQAVYLRGIAPTQ